MHHRKRWYNPELLVPVELLGARVGIAVNVGFAVNVSEPAEWLTLREAM
jgi:hypothetical protein